MSNTFCFSRINSKNYRKLLNLLISENSDILRVWRYFFVKIVFLRLLNEVRVCKTTIPLRKRKKLNNSLKWSFSNKKRNFSSRFQTVRDYEKIVPKTDKFHYCFNFQKTWLPSLVFITEKQNMQNYWWILRGPQNFLSTF